MTSILERLRSAALTTRPRESPNIPYGILNNKYLPHDQKTNRFIMSMISNSMERLRFNEDLCIDLHPEHENHGGSYLLYKYHMDRVKRIWYLSPMRAAKVQASLRIRAVSPEPSLLTHRSSESSESR